MAQRANLEIRGNRVFTDKELRSHLKEELETIEEYGLTSARADDAAFFLELFYKKHGYATAEVSYTIESANRFRLNVFEGPLVHLGKIDFIGNHDVPARKLFKYAVSPTRERYPRLKSALPFVSNDINEGANLVQRFYVSQGYIHCTVDSPSYEYVRPDLVTARIVVHEGQQYFFGNLNFVGPTIYGAGSVARPDPGFASASLHRRASDRYSAAVAGLLTRRAVITR